MTLEYLEPIPGHFSPPEACASTQFPNETTRVKAIIGRLMAASPDVFNDGLYAADSFCIKVVDGDDTITATGDSKTRTIEIGSHFASPENSEESVADVLAHELGHILLQHSWNGNQLLADGPQILQPWLAKVRTTIIAKAELNASLEKLVTHPEFAVCQKDLEALPWDGIMLHGPYGVEAFRAFEKSLKMLAPANGKGKQELDLAVELAGEIQSSIDTAKQELRKVLGTNEKHAQLLWQGYREFRADRVGLVLYTRAGFPRSKFFYNDIKDELGLQSEICLKDLEAINQAGGSAKIPESCFSLDIKDSEEEWYYDLKNLLGKSFSHFYPKPILRWAKLFSLKNRQNP